MREHRAEDLLPALLWVGLSQLLLTGGKLNNSPGCFLQEGRPQRAVSRRDHPSMLKNGPRG